MSITTARRVAEHSLPAYQNLIGGKWQPASDGRTVDMVSPSDGQAFAKIARGSKADVDAAVRAARHAFEDADFAAAVPVVVNAIVQNGGQTCSAGSRIELPFGGVRKNGHGREKGMEALHEFSHTKTIVFKHG